MTNLVICPTCGTANIYWLSDEKAADGYDYEPEDNAQTHHFHCNNCGTDVIVIEPRKDERENEYKDYWKDRDGH